jgi:hypothetical protein
MAQLGLLAVDTDPLPQETSAPPGLRSWRRTARFSQANGFGCR